MWETGKVFAFARFTNKQLYYIVTSMEEETKEVQLPYDIFGYDKVAELEDVFGAKIEFSDEKGSVNLKVPARVAYILKVQA